MVKILITFLAFATTVIFAQQKCGQTPIPPNIGTRVVGGQIATQYSWPWQIVWCSNGWFGCDLECGGTIIHSHWAMTAGNI